MIALPQHAMLLAAGLGLRMRPLTEHMPKPLIPVSGKPLIDYTLDQFAQSGVSHVVVNSHYKAEMLQAHLAKRKHPRISLSHEPLVLETGGGIANALPLLGNTAFFSANSDVICIDGATPALHRLAEAWDDAAMDALLLLYPCDQAVGFVGPGDFFLDANGVLTRRGDAPSAPYVFTGMQLLHPRLFNDAPPGAFSMNVLYNRDLSRVRGLVHNGSWLHIGDPQGLKEAEDWFASRQVMVTANALPASR